MTENVNLNSADSSLAGTTEEAKTSTPKTFTQEEVNLLISKRLNEASTKADERTKTAIAEALAEQERRAKMTEEQKLDEEFKTREDDIAEKERNITLRENRADAIEKLAELNIDTKLVDFVVDLDRDVTLQNVTKLSKAFNEAVSKAVEQKLSGKTPTDFGDGSKSSTDKKDAMTAKGYRKNGVTAF